MSSYFNAHQKHSIFALSKHRPRPSMLTSRRNPLPFLTFRYDEKRPLYSPHCEQELCDDSYEPVDSQMPDARLPPYKWCPCSILDSDALSCICVEDTGIFHVPDEVPRYWNADADRPSANSTISAICAPVCDLLCNRDVSITQSDGEHHKMVSPYKSPSFRP